MLISFLVHLIEPNGLILGLRQVTKKECSLRVRVPPKEEPLPTPEVDIVDDEDEENSQGLILVQSVLRGRAAQILVSLIIHTSIKMSQLGN